MHFPNLVKKKKALPPLRTMAEMAKELGVTVPVLRGAFIRDKNHPKARFDQSGNFVGAANKSQYDPKEFRTWWKAHTESKLSA